MSIRKKLGSLVYRMNDEWMKKGVRLKLYIWEDFTIGYSGKHKQQEYIDKMVLPSNLCIFMFSDRVGKFTKMELEAKLAQNKDAVVCYRVPVNKKFKDDVKNELDGLDVPFMDVADDVAICRNIKAVIEDRIQSLQHVEVEDSELNNLYFYTTIPDDLNKVQDEMDTSFSDLDDYTINSQNIHCILHPRMKLSLLDETDHYIPILFDKTSEDDLKELKAGVEKAKESSHRLKRMTVFDMQNIFKTNARVHDILDKEGIFTDKIKDLNGMKWKLIKWISEERRTLFSSQPIQMSVLNQKLLIDNIPVANVASMDDSEAIQHLVTAIDEQERNLQMAIASGEDDGTIQMRVAKMNTEKGHLNFLMVRALNSWTSKMVSDNPEMQELVYSCKGLDYEVSELLKDGITDSSAIRLKELLEQKEKEERHLVSLGGCDPIKLLDTQMMLVGVYDTFLPQDYDNRKAEDELYGRIVEDAEQVGLKDPNVEVMRMNLGNMYNRIEDVAAARENYHIAIDNLQSINDGSVRIVRYITFILVHLVHMEQERDFRASASTLMLFQEHVSRLDELNNEFLIDRCIYITAALTGIDIEDDSLVEFIEKAEDLYAKVNEHKGDLEASTDTMIYGDLFVYMPNIIARYYIDHRPRNNYQLASDYCQKAESWIKEALGNNVKFKKMDYLVGLHMEGELLHQLGFLYGLSQARWNEASRAYVRALDLRKRYFELSKEPISEVRIAQTLVNLGGLEQKILENSHHGIECIKEVLAKAEIALDIYGRHISVSSPDSEMEYYEALQLRATILDVMYRDNPGAIRAYNQAMKDYLNCWKYAKSHPMNPYRRTFMNYTGKILKERKFITEEEYNKVIQAMGLNNDGI